MRTVSAATPTPLIIPDHELLQPIGRGSYGEVWLARSVLGTLRAVKIVRRAAFSNARPFEREFAGIQRFEPLSRTQDGLVDILQVGRSEEEGFFYYVMELADPMPGGDGTTYVPRSLASELVARRSLPVPECVHHFHGLALALAHLHRAGLVHRDIKPSNIIFVDGVAKFADVGLVASADDSLSYVGTEGFIPPEGAGTTRADIFSLGKVLYEAATGRDRHEFPTLPLELADLEMSSGLLELNSLWLKACATSPADRYPSADDFAADLALLQAGRSVKQLRLVERRLRQATQLAMAIAVLAVLAITAGIIARRQASQERESRRQEELLRRRAEVAERSAQDRLSEAHIAQARAVLQGQQIGRSAVALALLTNRFSPALRVQARSLAATALAQPDLVPIPQILEDPAPESPTVEPQPDGSITVRARRGGPVLASVPSQGERVRDPLMLSRDQRYLYAGYGDYLERIWDLQTGRKVVTLDTNYFSLAFRPHHSQVVVEYTNGEVALHELPEWNRLHTWPASTSPAAPKWSPDGQRLLLMGPGAKLQLVDASTYQTQDLDSLGAEIQATSWHPQGAALAYGTGDGYLRVRAIQAWTASSVLGRHQAQIIQSLFLPPYPWLLTSSWDGTSRLWDWHAGQELGRIEATGYDIHFQEAQGVLHWRLGSEPNSRSWRLTGGDISRQWFYGDPHVSSGPFMASFSGDGQWLAAPDVDGIRIWHFPTATLACFRPGFSQALHLNQDGSELLSNSGGAIRRWKLTRLPGDPTHLEAREIANYGPEWNEGKIAANAEGSVVAWIHGMELHVVDHGKMRIWSHGQEMAETVAVSPDGRWIAVGTRNHRGVRIFSTPDGHMAWSAPVGFGTHLAMSADSRWLGVGTDSGCYVFALTDGTLRWHRSVDPAESPAFWELAFSPNGELLAWTPKPSRIQLLDAATGHEVLTLEYPTRRYITRLVFSPDGNTLVETSTKHILQLWNLAELRRQLTNIGLDW